MEIILSLSTGKAATTKAAYSKIKLPTLKLRERLQNMSREIIIEYCNIKLIVDVSKIRLLGRCLSIGSQTQFRN
jgi:hypothetical protein